MCLLGPNPVDFKRFYLEKGSVPSIYAKPKDTDYPRNEGKLANRFFPEKRSLDVSLGLCRETSVSKIPLPPPKKKVDFFPDRVRLFEICFRSSKMTDPRPCPTGWSYFRALSRSTKTCQAQTYNYLPTAKIDILKGQRNITGQNTPSPNVYRTFLGKKLICPASSLNNIKAG